MPDEIVIKQESIERVLPESTVTLNKRWCLHCCSRINCDTGSDLCLACQTNPISQDEIALNKVVKRFLDTRPRIKDLDEHLQEVEVDIQDDQPLVSQDRVSRVEYDLYALQINAQALKKRSHALEKGASTRDQETESTNGASECE